MLSPIVAAFVFNYLFKVCCEKWSVLVLSISRNILIFHPFYCMFEACFILFILLFYHQSFPYLSSLRRFPRCCPLELLSSCSRSAVRSDITLSLRTIDLVLSSPWEDLPLLFLEGEAPPSCTEAFDSFFFCPRTLSSSVLLLMLSQHQHFQKHRRY